MSEGPERENPSSPAAGSADSSAAAPPPDAKPSPASPPAASPPSTDPGSHEDDDDTDDDDEDDAEQSETDSEPDNVASPRPESDHSAAEDRPRDSTPALAGEAVWGTIARSVALAALLGFALVAWLQLSLSGRAANDFLASNALELSQRMTTIKACIGGAALAAAAAGYFLWSTLKKRENVGLIERWLWFLSPLLLAPGLASVLHYKPWVNEHARLLPIVLILGITFEVLAFQSIKNAPRAARDWWQEAFEQIPPVARKHGPFALVLAGSLFYVVFFSFYLLRWHYKLRTGNFDLSINNNLMFGGLHGHFLESTVVFPQDPKKYLANHAKFGGYLFLPIYALFPKPQTLLVIQSTLIGVSALPLFGFARRHLSEWLAALVALAYLAYYPMHGASFSEFQYVPIAGFFVLTTIWAAETRRWVLFGIVFVVGITMREDIPIGMAVVGAFLLLSGHRPLPGLIMAAVSSVYFVVLRFHIMESAGDWWFPNMYKELWSEGAKGFRSVILTLISNPLFVISKILVEKKLIYILHLFVPLLFLPARRWYLWAAFIPGGLLTLLITNYDPPITFSFHYVMHWAPYLFAASVLALKSIAARPDFGTARVYSAGLAMAAASAVLSYNYGAFPVRDGTFKGGFQRVDFTLSDAERERYANLQELIALIPKDASLAATEKIGPHASSRLLMYTMRHGPQNAEYALASSRELKLARTRPKLLEALRSGRYGVVKRIADLALFKRGYDTSNNERLIRDWRLSDARAPAPEVQAPPPEPAPEQKPPEDEAAEPRDHE
ncbi:MAG TPA: DUF2079 domain-containing protein [Polyangiaceae bacterium]|nr:DUF2079 domain-containing protein [Polyangiaceae bacterium]